MLWSGWPWNCLGWNGFLLAFERVQFKLFSWAVWKIRQFSYYVVKLKSRRHLPILLDTQPHILSETPYLLHFLPSVVMATSDENLACFIHHVSWLPRCLYVLYIPQYICCRATHVHRRVSTLSTNVCFETEGQEMLLLDVNGLIVCKDKCGHKDSYEKKNISERLITCSFNPRAF